MVLNILTLLSGDLSEEWSLFGKPGWFAILYIKPPLIYLLNFGSPRERCMPLGILQLPLTCPA